MKRNQLLPFAIKLRKHGYSYNEIHERLNIPKGTCYSWLKNIKLNDKAIVRIQRIQQLGRKRGQQVNHNRALVRDADIDREVFESLRRLKLDKTLKKLFCSMLYWGEGSKGQNRVVFTNSDPIMVKTFLSLFRESYPLSENRFQASLHLHSYHNREVQKKFWSKISAISLHKISIYDKKNSGTNRREGYPGCISVRYNDVNISRDLEAHYKNFVKIYGGLV